MASIRERNRSGLPPAYSVLWRDPDTGRQTSWTTDDRRTAETMRRLIEANGGRLGAAQSTLAAIRRRSPLVSTIIEDHIAGLPSVTERTRADYRRDARLHITPYLGAVPVEELTPEQVKTWLRTISDRRKPGAGEQRYALSDKTIANIHGLLSTALATACKAGLRADNPCVGMRLPRRSEHTSTEMVCLSKSEWAVLRGEIAQRSGGHYSLLMDTLVGTGMRWGEAVALQVRALDLDAAMPTVRISQAVRKDETGTAYVGPTKTRRSRRTVSLPTSLVGPLRDLTNGRPADALVFRSAAGGRVSHSTVYEWIWRPAIRDAQDHERHPDDALAVTPRIHDLRHTHASWLIAAGVDMMTVQRRLGHESITTTIDRYSHLLPGQQVAAAAAIDALL